MPKNGSSLVTGIISGSIILLMLGLFLVIFLLYYQKKHNSHLTEKNALRKQFEDDLLVVETEVQEQTRQKLAIDLHDNIGQILSLTSITLASFEIEDSAGNASKLQDARDLVTRSIRELRQLSRVVQGEQIITTGLISAVEQELNWLRNKGYYKVDFSSDLDENLDNADSNLLIFRIFQEALNNIVKHADAETITVNLTSKYGELEMSVIDDGKGFHVAPTSAGGLGLLTMKKRAGLIGGSMNLWSEPSKGTKLIFTFPYE